MIHTKINMTREFDCNIEGGETKRRDKIADMKRENDALKINTLRKNEIKEKEKV